MRNRRSPLQLVLTLGLLVVAVLSVFNLAYYPAIRKHLGRDDSKPCNNYRLSSTVAGLFSPENVSDYSHLPAVFVDDPSIVDLDSRCYSLLSQDFSSPRDLTVVTGLFDLGRGKMNVTDNNFGFERKFEEYVERFKRILRRRLPMVVYMPKLIYEKYFVEEIAALPHHKVIFKTNEEIKAEFEMFDEVQQIRNRPEWKHRAGWLPDSPQSKLELYNPLVMSKIFWLRDVAESNPLNTTYFLWLDAGHLCGTDLDANHMGVFKHHMDKFFVTHFPYLPDTEIHGFEHAAFDKMVGVRQSESQARHEVRVVRGGVFGGTLKSILPVVPVYRKWMVKSLSEGFMGTEENLFSLAMYEHPELFHAYDNSIDGGMDNCKIFSMARVCMPLKSGGRTLIKEASPEVVTDATVDH